MAEIEKWIDEIKNKTLYEAKVQNNLPMLLLEQTETNSRYSERMARLKVAIENVIDTFPVGYKEEFEGFFYPVVTSYRSLDGWSVKKAIEAQGVGVQLEGQEKKKGIFW